MTTSDEQPPSGSQQTPAPEPEMDGPRMNATNLYVLLAIIFGIFTYLSFTPPLDKLQWPTTKGMVTQIGYSEKTSGTPFVNYEYTINGTKYTKSEPLSGWTTMTVTEGHPLVVIYSPNDPNVAEFLPGINSATYVLGSVSIVLLVMSIIGVMKTMSSAIEPTADGAQADGTTVVQTASQSTDAGTPTDTQNAESRDSKTDTT